LTLGVFQNLLGNSVNSESLKASSFLDLFWCERVGSSNEPLKFAEFLSKDSVNFERPKGWKKYPPGSKKRNFGVRKKAISHPCHKGSCFLKKKETHPFWSTMSSTAHLMIYRRILGIATLFYISIIQRKEKYSAVMY